MRCKAKEWGNEGEIKKKGGKMPSLNKVMIIGNLGADPELRYTPNGKAVTDLRIAVNQSYSTADGERKQETEWFSVVVWNKTAENCSQYLTKGRKVYVEGRLRTRSWEGDDGQKRYRTEVVAQNVLFLDKLTDAPEIKPDDLPF